MCAFWRLGISSDPGRWAGDGARQEPRVRTSQFGLTGNPAALFWDYGRLPAAAAEDGLARARRRCGDIPAQGNHAKWKPPWGSVLTPDRALRRAVHQSAALARRSKPMSREQRDPPLPKRGSRNSSGIALTAFADLTTSCTILRQQTAHDLPHDPGAVGPRRSATRRAEPSGSSRAGRAVPEPGRDRAVAVFCTPRPYPACMRLPRTKSEVAVSVLLGIRWDEAPGKEAVLPG